MTDPRTAAMQDTERLLAAVEEVAAALQANDAVYRNGLEALAQGQTITATLDLTNAAQACQLTGRYAREARGGATEKQRGRLRRDTA